MSRRWGAKNCGGGEGAGAGFGRARIGVKSHVPGLGPRDKEKRRRKKSLMEDD
jgi:hypothetical protein